MKKSLRYATLFAVAAVWLALVAAAWLKPARDISDAERRKLARFPELSTGNVWNGTFMDSFEDYSVDQFPLRQTFRQIKSLFHYYVLGQKDNNGIYIAEGSAAKLEYPVNDTSLANAGAHFNRIYELYLENSENICFAVVPDKGYYLAPEAGYPALDYAGMVSTLEQQLPWANFVDLRETLDADSYYRTDTHWRQERILDAAGVLCEALGVQPPGVEDYTQREVEQPFYGVYYGQAALPMKPDTMYLVESPLLDGCSVYNLETGKTTGIYDLEKLSGRDPYDVYLSGAAALLTIENSQGQPGSELIVFRDSFGSSMIPLILRDYEKVTVVDTRYMSAELLGEYIDFSGQDVLFLYSTLILNNSATLK